MAARLSPTRKPNPIPKADPKPAGEGGDGRKLGADDNVRAAYESEQAQLVSIVHQIMAQQRSVKAAKAVFEEALAEIKAPLDAAKARELELFRLAKAAKFERQWIEAYIAKMNQDTRERVEDVKRERRHLSMLSIQTEEQLSLFGSETPVEVRDEAYWKAEGYLAYHRGELCKPPAECPQRFTQACMQGWNDAQTATILAMGKVAETPPPPADALAPDEPIEAPEPTRAELKAQEKRARESLDALGAIAEAETEAHEAV